MGRVSDLLTSLFSKGGTKAPPNVEDLRNAFKARYHQFKLLLSANNRALEIMTELGEAQKGAWPFSMSFVRSRCTSVSTSVFQMVKHLNELGEGEYLELYDRFKEIQRRINPFVYPSRSRSEGPLVIPIREVGGDLADQVGSKIANLGELRNRFHLNVSEGFAITARAYQLFIEHNELQTEIDRSIQATNVDRLDQLYALSAGIQQMIIGAEIPRALEEAILGQYRLMEAELGAGITVAMRSSALGEDLPGTTFAGQYRSELNVSGENILRVYKEIVASKYGVPAMTYRLNRGIRDEDVAMCVGCLHMVDATCGGVLYTRNPVDIRDDSMLINSVWGLPKSVVDGRTAVDQFFISRSAPMKIQKKEIPTKDQEFLCYPDEGVCRMALTEDRANLPSLTDAQALELARAAAGVEEYYGVALDLEWAIASDGRMILLQCRPLRQAEGRDEEVLPEEEQ
ncbi:MAG: PEP/pyruvate-binding domain-containing protein, partial [Deltaproteobacteria bacterium]|nr:PEP/pyruvate-binding domain-containing protein [Deltaproteobacteria bacterium]